MAINYKRVVTSISLVVFTSQIAPYACASGTVVTPPRTKCFIEIEDPHISTYILKKVGRLAVKVNATSRCTAFQTDVALTVKIFKKGLGPDQLLRQKSTDPNNPKSSGFLVRNTSTFVYCKNTKPTKFYGVAYAQTYINGKRFGTVPVFSENPVVLNCGT